MGAAHNSMPQRGPREGPARDSASHLRRIRRPRAAQMQPATLRIFGDTSAAPGPLYARAEALRKLSKVKNTLKSLSRALKTASPRPQIKARRRQDGVAQTTWSWQCGGDGVAEAAWWSDADSRV